MAFRRGAVDAIKLPLSLVGDPLDHLPKRVVIQVVKDSQCRLCRVAVHLCVLHNMG
jgi:hypothetical protein